MAEMKWRTLGVGVARPVGYQFRTLGRPGATWIAGEQARYGMILRDYDCRNTEYRAPVLDEPEATVTQPVVVAAFLDCGQRINVTSDGAWWACIDSRWERTAPPIAAKGGE